MQKEINQVFKFRRQRLIELLPCDSIALIFSNDYQIRNRDINYPFRQDSNFLYLTGFNEPDSILVLMTDQSKGVDILFCRPKNHSEEIWQGERLGLTQAKETLNVETAIDIESFQDLFSGWIENKKNIYFNLQMPAKQYQKIKPFLCGMESQDTMIESLHEINHLIHPMRMIKSPEEIMQIQIACDISVLAHKQAMKACKPGQYEYELESILISEFIRKGARFSAYESIVASGQNGCTLHYTNNNSRIKPDDLVLIDAGCEWQGYASDITRTFPASGVFSSAQCAIYDLVLLAQMTVIEALAPGIYWQDMHQLSVKIMTQGLLDLNILEGTLSHLIESKAIQRFYMHGIGHFLGLDVHDVGSMKHQGKRRPLESGMVLTVEPGLYFDQNDLTIPESFRGISVRIEDDLLITPTGVRVLTADLPKTSVEIEAWMKV
ncbi:MAG: M24 family metallopeptidase [Endozoicomonadaceae bacterium]|nr:M24 family metallopeptidase [Endozoicomonadaceae bacterium]